MTRFQSFDRSIHTAVKVTITARAYSFRARGNVFDGKLWMAQRIIDKTWTLGAAFDAGHHAGVLTI
jgi:hypothetical protein